VEVPELVVVTTEENIAEEEANGEESERVFSMSWGERGARDSTTGRFGVGEVTKDDLAPEWLWPRSGH
jgi:hypothetical protein